MSRATNFSLPPTVLDRYNVKNVIDNGMDRTTKGGPEQSYIHTRAASPEAPFKYRAVTLDQIPPGGLTGPIIDPIACAEVDPTIVALWGQVKVNPGWSRSEFGPKVGRVQRAATDGYVLQRTLIPLLFFNAVTRATRGSGLCGRLLQAAAIIRKTEHVAVGCVFPTIGPACNAQKNGGDGQWGVPRLLMRDAEPWSVCPSPPTPQG